MPKYVVGCMRVDSPNRNGTVISEQVAREALQRYMERLAEQEMLKTYRIFVDGETAKRLGFEVEIEE